MHFGPALHLPPATWPLTWPLLLPLVLHLPPAACQLPTAPCPCPYLCSPRSPLPLLSAPVPAPASAPVPDPARCSALCSHPCPCSPPTLALALNPTLPDPLPMGCMLFEHISIDSISCVFTLSLPCRTFFPLWLASPLPKPAEALTRRCCVASWTLAHGRHNSILQMNAFLMITIAWCSCQAQLGSSPQSK